MDTKLDNKENQGPLFVIVIVCVCNWLKYYKCHLSHILEVKRTFLYSPSC